MYKYEYCELKKQSETEKGKEIISLFEKTYNEEYKDVPIKPIKYADFKLFAETGDRATYEKQYLDRRKRLALLQVLAIKSDEYIRPLEEILAVICEEFTWAYPAHCYNVYGDRQFDYTIIDLYASETGMYLAETAYVLRNKLSEDILKRIKIKLKANIFRFFFVGFYA